MQITFWGVRGSYPVPGAATVRYGGQTSCVEARSATGDCVIVDAGTGLRALGNKLMREATAPQQLPRAALARALGSHPGPAVLLAGVRARAPRIAVYALLTAADELQQVIGGITRHEFFPMPLEAVPAQFDFHQVEPGVEFDIGDVPRSRRSRSTIRSARSAIASTAMARRGRTSPTPRRSTEVLHKQHFLPGLEPLTDDDKVLARRDARGAGAPARRRRHRRLRHALPPRGVRAVPALRPLDAGSGARDLRRGEESAGSSSITTRRRTATTRWTRSRRRYLAKGAAHRHRGAHRRSRA